MEGERGEALSEPGEDVGEDGRETAVVEVCGAGISDEVSSTERGVEAGAGGDEATAERNKARAQMGGGETERDCTSLPSVISAVEARTSRYGESGSCVGGMHEEGDGEGSGGAGEGRVENAEHDCGAGEQTGAEV